MVKNGIAPIETRLLIENWLVKNYIHKNDSCLSWQLEVILHLESDEKWIRVSDIIWRRRQHWCRQKCQKLIILICRHEKCIPPLLLLLFAAVKTNLIFSFSRERQRQKICSKKLPLLIIFRVWRLILIGQTIFLSKHQIKTLFLQMSRCLKSIICYFPWFCFAVTFWISSRQSGGVDRGGRKASKMLFSI